MKVMTDLYVHADDVPNRRFSTNGNHCIEFTKDGPLLLLGALTDGETLRYLRLFQRQCALLEQDIERAAGRQP